MNLQTTRSEDGKTLVLSVNGEQRHYPHDKEGKRQAILDGLNAVETVATGRDVYLPNDAALQMVAAVLFPDGIQTADAYQTVCRVTKKACAHLGFGEEVELGPPQVPFHARGAYRKQHPGVDATQVQTELELAGTSSLQPRREMKRPVLWNKLAWELYNNSLSLLTTGRRQLLATQVDAAAEEAGWQIEADTDLYFQPLPADADRAREKFSRYLAGTKGLPLSQWSAVSQVQIGAYGRSFYDESLTAELQAVLEDVLQAYGYQTEPEDGDYLPRPVTLPVDGAATLMAQLSALEPVQTTFGPALLYDRVLTIVRGLAGGAAISEWQAQQLLDNGATGRALRELGYQTKLTWCQPYHFQPRLADKQVRAEPRQVLLKLVRVQNDPDKKLSLAKGLAVHTPAVAIDDEAETLVYLQMVGPKQAVKANWAALVGGGKVHWLGRKRVQLNGMKEHIKIQSSLPCGWADQILIHKQASLKAMNPEQPFYLLDDGTQRIPPLFYAMLNKSLALPLLEDWSAYLWETGREQQLIHLLDDGAGQGYAAWRVLPAPEGWQELVQTGMQRKQICF